MKNIVLAFLFMMAFSSLSLAQQFAGLDKSPMDRAYFPHNFAHDRKAGEKAIIRVTYSRPAMTGREVMGKLVPYGKVWRSGANEATEIQFYQDVTMAGKKVKTGTYSLFTIPGEKEWTIILSSDLDYWGAYSYKDSNDVVKVTAPVSALDSAVQNFTIQFDKKGDKQGIMKIAWDKTVVDVPFNY
ncbi:MAG: DUF2911 domain-containing protein [Chitinophagaceae bacterium]